jgi:hypothetical protein
MAIRPVCDKCQAELKEFGGVLLSPPDSKNKVLKLHLCKTCYSKILESFKKKGSTPMKKVLK